jgi:uncharacterized SAM-binding protein YcdF (DUF218 family)
MPRALRLFRAAGKTPLAAPTAYVALDTPGPDLGDFFPSPGALGNAAFVFHEYLGRVWSRLRGQL